MSVNRNIGARRWCAVIVTTTMFLLSCVPKAEEGVRPVGEIVYLEGDVSLNGVPVDIGATARDGDVLETGPGAYAEVQFGESQIFRASENTALTLNGDEGTLDMELGALAMIQSKVRFLFFNKSWDVTTPLAVASVRGTTYYIKMEDENTAYVCICNGEIALHDTDEVHDLDLEASHHKAVRFIRQPGGGIVYEEAPMIYHTDEEMESLAAQVNVEIDWTKIP